MNIKPFVIGCCGSLLSFALTLPAFAAQLQSWRFDQQQNRLTFTTDTGIRPQARFIRSANRIIIDLPETSSGSVRKQQIIGNGIRDIQVTRLTADSTRLIVQLEPNYSINPNQIVVRGETASSWIVQLPTLEPTAASGTQALPILGPETRQPSTVSDPVQASGMSTRIMSFRITPNGLLLKTDGNQPNVTLQRSRDRRRIDITLPNTIAPPILVGERLEAPDLGANQVILRQSSQPSQGTTISLTVDPNSPDWQARTPNAETLVLMPKPRGGSTRVGEVPDPPALSADFVTADVINLPSPPPLASNPTANNSASNSRNTNSRNTNTVNVGGTAQPVFQPVSSSASSTADRESSTSTVQPDRPDSLGYATIDKITVNPVTNQLLIRTDRPLNYRGRWRGGRYQLTLSPARLAPTADQLKLPPNSPITSIRLRQRDDNSVQISLRPAPGVDVRRLQAQNSQLLAIAFEPSNQPSPSRPYPIATPAPLPNPLPRPNPVPSPSPQPRPVPRPSPSQNRVVIAIDPGHGGRDPGAVGIGGLQEKTVVNAISDRVAQNLRQQGFEVVMTRTSDREVDLAPRVATAERANADLFVSIHANAISLSRPEVNGVETYYYSNQGRNFASQVHQRIIQAMNVRDRGIKSARFYVLRNTSMPAILIETGFVTGAEDARNLANPAWRNRMADTISQGIAQYAAQTL